MEAEETRRNFQNFSRQVVDLVGSRTFPDGDISEIGYYFVTGKKEGRKEEEKEKRERNDNVKKKKKLKELEKKVVD